MGLVLGMRGVLSRGVGVFIGARAGGRGVLLRGMLGSGMDGVDGRHLGGVGFIIRPVCDVLSFSTASSFGLP
jgi:hypothetical protein